MPLCSNLFSPNVIAFTSDATIDFTWKEGQCAIGSTQHDYLRRQLGRDVGEPLLVRQVHGNTVLNPDVNKLQKGSPPPEADGLITRQSGLALAVRTADCLPVFLWAPDAGGVGLVHAGWRGTHKNIVQVAIERMRREWGADPGKIHALLGPAIRPCCYEVGGEFQEYFPHDCAARNGHFYLDLAGCVQQQLIDSGIKKEKISDCGICTGCDTNYFSFRREGESAGRMISLIMLKGTAA